MMRMHVHVALCNLSKHSFVSMFQCLVQEVTAANCQEWQIWFSIAKCTPLFIRENGVCVCKITPQNKLALYRQMHNL